MIRANIEKKSELGLKVKKIVDSGEFVSDEVILSMVIERVTKKNEKILFLFNFSLKKI